MPTITEAENIQREIESLPYFELSRAREILHEHPFIRRNADCAVVSYYVSGFSNILRLAADEFARIISFTPSYLVQSGRAVKVDKPAPGNLALWYEDRNKGFEHAGVALGGELSFSMLGINGPLAVETFEETKRGYAELGLNLQTPVFLKRII